MGDFIEPCMCSTSKKIESLKQKYIQEIISPMHQFETVQTKENLDPNMLSPSNMKSLDFLNILNNNDSFNLLSNRNNYISENSNTMQMALILDKLVDKISNDIEKRLCLIEKKIENLEKIEIALKNNNQPHNANDSKELDFSNYSPLNQKKEDLRYMEAKIERIEENFERFKNEINLNMKGFSTDIEKNIEIFLDTSKNLKNKLENFFERKDHLLEIETFQKGLEERIGRLEDEKEELFEKNEENKGVIGKIEDDFMQFFENLKDVNDLRMNSKKMGCEILEIKCILKQIVDERIIKIKK